jgi:hypothetical protein
MRLLEVHSGLTPAGPVVLASAAWPAGPDDELPAIPGFIVSSFNPLVAEVAERCLRAAHGAPPADPARGVRTGVVLVSARGDTGTADAVDTAVRAGRRVAPLLFFQSNPNAVVGYVTARWRLAGPLVCLSPAGGAVADGLAAAELLLQTGDAAEVLVIAADQAVQGGPDHAVALLIGLPPEQPPGTAPAQPPTERETR